MRILRNYILKDFAAAFCFGLLILTMVMLLGNIMKLSDMVVRKGVSLFDALRIFSFFLPYIVGFTLPLAFLMGVLLSMGRLVGDNEIVAINVAGVSVYRILCLFLVLSAICSLFLLFLNDKVIPGFHYRYRTEIKNIYSKNMGALIEPGVFMENFDGYIIYVSDVENNILKNVYIYETKDNKATSKVTFAKTADFVVEGDSLKMKLNDGFRDETDVNNPGQLYRLMFKTFFTDIPIAQKRQNSEEKKRSDMTIAELRDKMMELKAKGIKTHEFSGEIHQRISFAFSALVFTIFGFGISLVVRHREKSINFGIAFLIAGFYYLLFILGTALVEYQKIAPWVGMWMPNIIVLTAGLIVMFKNAHFK
jgi:lipopolysaccharide export system permease protein